jgi:hypothetical protein
MGTPYILCVSIFVTIILLVITFLQSFQIHCIKKELKKCLKVISRCKPNFEVENAISQIKNN